MPDGDKFDYAAAKKAGYSDQEIQGFLHANYGFNFDITSARKSGYSDNEINSYLSSQSLKKKVGGIVSPQNQNNGSQDVSTQKEDYWNAGKPAISSQQVLDAQRHTQDVGSNNSFQQSVEGAKQATDERHTQAANNTAALYFKNNPQAISNNDYSLKTLPKKNMLNVKGGDKFSLKNLQHATPFQIKAAQIKSDLDNGKLTTYTTDEGEIRAAKPKTGLNNTIANFKQAWNANAESGKILSMNDDEFKQYVASKSDNEYLPEKADAESLSGQVGANLPIAIKGTVGGVAGSVMAAAAPETGGLTGLGLPTVMAWMLTAPEMAKTQAAQGKIKAYKDAIAEGKTPDEAIEIAKHMATANYAEGMALGTTLMALPSFVPKSASEGFLKSYAQHLAMLPTEAGAQGLTAGGLTELKDEYAKHLGLNITDAQKSKDFNDSFNGMAGTALAFGVVHGLIPSDGATKSQAKNVISKIPEEQLHQFQDASIKSGELTQEQVDAANKGLQDYNEAGKKIIPTGNEEKDGVIKGLIEKRNALEKLKTEKDVSFHPEIDAQIEDANKRIQLAKDSENPIRYAETDDVTGQTHFPTKAFDELSRPEKNNIEVPKEFGITVIKPNENERFGAIVEIGGKQQKVEGDFASKEGAEKAADDILKQQYYENELPSIEKPESKKKPEIASQDNEAGNSSDGLQPSIKESSPETSNGEAIQLQQEKINQDESKKITNNTEEESAAIEKDVPTENSKIRNISEQPQDNSVVEGNENKKTDNASASNEGEKYKTAKEINKLPKERRDAIIDDLIFGNESGDYSKVRELKKKMGFTDATDEEIGHAKEGMNGKSSKDVLTHILNNTSDQQLRNVAQALLKNVEKIKDVKFKFDLVPDSNGYPTEHNGVYRNGQIVVNEKTFWTPTSVAIKNGLDSGFKTILHEYVHAATLEAYRHPKTIADREFKAYIDKAYRELKSNSDKSLKLYGFESPTEFITEVVTNKEFQKLASIYKPNLLSKIVNYVAKILGYSKDVTGEQNQRQAKIEAAVDYILKSVPEISGGMGKKGFFEKNIDINRAIERMKKAGFDESEIKDEFEKRGIKYSENDLNGKFQNEVSIKDKTEKPKTEDIPAEQETEKSGEPNTTGGHHEALNKIADRLGLPPIEKGDVLSPEEYTKRGQLLLKSGADPKEIADEFEKTGKVNADMIGVAKAHLANLDKAAEQARTDFGESSKEFSDAKKAADDWARYVMKPMGTKFGEIGRALQGETDIDTGSFVSVQRAFEEKNKKPMTPAQEAEAKKLVAQVKGLTDEVNNLKKKLSENADKGASEEQTDKTKKYAAKAKKVADTFRKLKSKPFTFKDENGNDIPIQIQGLSWNDLVEFGAKAIEKTGEIVDGVNAIIEKVKDTDWYKKLSASDKEKFSEQLHEHYGSSIAETPEAKKIKALEKQLDNLRSGIVKDKGIKVEDTPEIKKLKDEIFEAKKNLGLISSRTSKVGEFNYGLKTVKEKAKISEEQKRINKLQKQLDDLESGNIKSKTEPFEDTPAIKDLKDKIFNAKKELGLIPSKGKTVKEPDYGLQKTQQQKNIERLEKQLEDLKNGVIKDKADKRPLSAQEKDLQDQIFEEKKKLGLIASKEAKSKEHDLEITAAEKKIERLQKEKEDLENGIVKQNKVSNIETTPEQQATIDKLDEEIADLKKNLGVTKSKAEKPLTEQEQVEAKQKDTEELASRFADKRDNKFSSEDVKDIWKYANETYLDHDADFGDMVNGVATDLGLTTEQVRHALAQPKEVKRITDEMYLKQHYRRKAQQRAEYFVNHANESGLTKLAKFVPRLFFNLKTFGHGTVGGITHAGMNIFNPASWKIYFPFFIKQFKYSFGGLTKEGIAKYEQSLEDMKHDKDYAISKRSGLAVDPDKVYDDYQNNLPIFKKISGMGDRGFNALKWLRLQLFKQEYNKLSALEKADPETAKNIATIMNHATGATNKSSSTAANTFFFAWNLEKSRWARLITQPAKALNTFASWNKSSAAEKVAAKIVARRAGNIISTYAIGLAANQALLSLTGSKQSINFTKPNESDFLKFKVAGRTLDFSGGMISAIDFLSNLAHIATESKEDLGRNTRTDLLTSTTGRYISGKFSPFLGTIKDFATHHDFEGNTMPFSNDKPKKGHHQLTWGEYLKTQQSPIPIAEAFKDIHKQLKDNGMSESQANAILQGIFVGALSGGTGVRIGEEPVTTKLSTSSSRTSTRQQERSSTQRQGRTN